MRAPWRAQPALQPVNHKNRSTVERSFQKQPPVQRTVALLTHRSYYFVVFTAKPTAATATCDPLHVSQPPQRSSDRRGYDL